MTGLSHGSRNSLARRIHPSLCAVSPISWSHFLFHHKPHPACTALLADLRACHSLHHRPRRMVDVQTDLARTSAYRADRIAIHSYLSRLQPALGRVHSHQPGTHPFYFLSALIWFYLQSAADQKNPPPTSSLHCCCNSAASFPQNIFSALKVCASSFYFSFFQGNLIERFTKTFKTWWPYLLIWILNAAWLIYYYKFGPYTSYEVTATQSLTVLTFLREALDSLWKAGFYIWIQVLVLTFTSLPAPASLLTLGLIAAFICISHALSKKRGANRE